ncbi:cupin domain-containing protein [Alphaproteobacteria bacterium]|jgi:50S ribosomal protein L16 3-hydroxylase|nr:cupin domain-containing protein [Alphaproteobacteria bacterium]
MSLILDALPTTEEFFREFWNKKPFVVRGMISKKIMGALIDEDHLAGLSLEEEVESRLVKKGKKQNDWTCDHGPFHEKDFAGLGEEDWSLLVQNIDKHHDATADLLKCFNFSPRWLLDDIMVSFSPKGGTVGAHTDSYHVFLVQGKGERCWKVANEPIKNEDYINDISLKILEASFEGEDITVTEGDVIYIPPKFAHQGISLKPSLTYSVGFLGPSLSDMLIQFGQYLEENHLEIPRYLGQNLTESAVPFHITPKHCDDLKFFMTDVFTQDYFNKWLTHYFCSPMQTYEEDYDDDANINVDDIIAESVMLIKRPAIKMLFIPLKASQKYCVSAGDVSFNLDFSDLFLVNMMAQETPFSAKIFINHTEILRNLLTQNILTRAET